MPITLTEMQKDALRETGNIGSGHAAIALSQLMGRKIMVVIPSVEVFLFKDLASVINGRGKRHVLVSLSVLGEARGAMIFVLEETVAMRLCEIVMGKNNDNVRELGEIEKSALKEVGSILAASYLNAVSQMTNMSLLISTPNCDIGDTTMMDKILAERDIDVCASEHVLCIKTEFIESAARIEGYIVFSPVEGAIEKILGRLGV